MKPPTARLLFKTIGDPTVHTRTYADVGVMKMDLEGIYNGNGWIEVRNGNERSHAFDECVRCSSIVWYRSEVYGVHNG